MDNNGIPLGDNQKRSLTVDGQPMALKTEEQLKAEAEAAKAELDAKLRRGEIDGAEYNRKLVEIRVPKKYEPKFASNFKKKNRRIIVAMIIIFLISTIPAAVYLNWRGFFRNTLTASSAPDYSTDLAGLGYLGPVQIDLDEDLSETGEYKGRPIDVTYKAYYDITGTVVSVRDYWGFDAYDSLVPRDVCIAWGGTEIKYRLTGLEFSQGERNCGGQANYPDFSNNHVIPSTAEVRSQVFGLRAGSKVRLVGYLVRVSYDGITLDSSMSRNDSGNHACEVFYVTKVEKP